MTESAFASHFQDTYSDLCTIVVVWLTQILPHFVPFVYLVTCRAKYVDSFCDTGVVRKRRRLERGCEDDGQGEGDTAKDTEGMQEPPSAFVTARDQYVRDCRTYRTNIPSSTEDFSYCCLYRLV